MATHSSVLAWKFRGQKSLAGYSPWGRKRVGRDIATKHHHHHTCIHSNTSSSQQRQKAFSTCSSHIIVVSITYGSCIFIYIKPSAKEGVAINKVVSVLTTSVAPLLNPFIYTLRNKQVKEAFKDTVKQVVFLTKK